MASINTLLYTIFGIFCINFLWKKDSRKKAFKLCFLGPKRLTKRSMFPLNPWEDPHNCNARKREIMNRTRNIPHRREGWKCTNSHTFVHNCCLLLLPLMTPSYIYISKASLMSSTSCCIPIISPPCKPILLDGIIFRILSFQTICTAPCASVLFTDYISSKAER